MDFLNPDLQLFPLHDYTSPSIKKSDNSPLSLEIQSTLQYNVVNFFSRLSRFYFARSKAKFFFRMNKPCMYCFKRRLIHFLVQVLFKILQEFDQT